MSYLNLPIFFKYTYGYTKARFRFLAGPQFSFLQSAEQVYTVNGQDMQGMLEFTNPNTGEKFDPCAHLITERFNSLDIMLVLDVGADIFLIEEMTYISAGMRFWYSVMDLNAEDYKIPNKEGVYEPSHNAGIFVYVGFHYIIGGKRLAESK